MQLFITWKLKRLNFGSSSEDNLLAMITCSRGLQMLHKRTEGLGMTRETRQANKKLSFPPKGCILPLTKNPNGRMLGTCQKLVAGRGAVGIVILGSEIR